MTSKSLPSDRSFGLTFAAVFAVLAAWLAYRHGLHWMACLVTAAAFGLVAVTIPTVLHPLNVAWMWFGRLLNRIVSPVVLGLIYFIVFTPVALLFALRGRDPLNRKFDAARPSYWLDRTPPGPDATRSFPHQF